MIEYSDEYLDRLISESTVNPSSHGFDANLAGLAKEIKYLRHELAVSTQEKSPWHSANSCDGDLPKHSDLYLVKHICGSPDIAYFDKWQKRWLSESYPGDPINSVASWTEIPE